MELELVWALADILNELMALPNPIGLLALSPIIVSELAFYFGMIFAVFSKYKNTNETTSTYWIGLKRP